jgi:hypothetical protein
MEALPRKGGVSAKESEVFDGNSVGSATGAENQSANMPIFRMRLFFSMPVLILMRQCRLRVQIGLTDHQDYLCSSQTLSLAVARTSSLLWKLFPAQDSSRKKACR